MSYTGMMLGVLLELGILIGLCLALGAIPFAIYSLCTGNVSRGLHASRIGCVLAQLSVLFSAFGWIVLLSGEYRPGYPVDNHDPDIEFWNFVAVCQEVALLASILSAVRQALRRNKAAREAAPRDERRNGVLAAMRRPDTVLCVIVPVLLIVAICLTFPRKLVEIDADIVVGLLRVWFGFGLMSGFLLAVGAIPFLIHGFLARDPRRAARSSRIASCLAFLSVLASAMNWLALIPGAPRFALPSEHTSVDAVMDAFRAIAVIEILVLVPTILCAMRQKARRVA